MSWFNPVTERSSLCRFCTSVSETLRAISCSADLRWLVGYFTQYCSSSDVKKCSSIQIFSDVSIKTIFFLQQAIQDITRNRDIVPEEIVTLIYEKIDVHGEGEHHLIHESPHQNAFIYSSEFMATLSTQNVQVNWRWRSSLKERKHILTLWICWINWWTSLQSWLLLSMGRQKPIKASWAEFTPSKGQWGKFPSWKWKWSLEV